MVSMEGKVVTCESVRRGHPDKLCDYISDSILDLYLSVDPKAHVACETMAANRTIIIAGEVKYTSDVEIGKGDRRVVVIQALTDVGYDPAEFEYEDYIHTQSSDIDMGVSLSEDEIGAGDQGTMFGYAVDETAEFLPAPLVASHRICKILDQKMKDDPEFGLKPDGKAQVSIQYDAFGMPKEVTTIVVSTQHAEGMSYSKLSKYIIGEVLPLALSGIAPITESTRILINPTGQFIIGGPEGDTGLTGRKLMVDSYGGYGKSGGGAWSGKDPSKVDRSAAYMARSIAKFLVAARVCTECTVSLSYSIGVPEPVAVYVDTMGTMLVDGISDDQISESVTRLIDLSPMSIINRLDLTNVEYKNTAAYGHFSDPTYPWETGCSEYYAVLRDLLVL